jgi:hypothetical protein
MDDEVDPEVQADLALRAETMRDRRPASTHLYGWTTPVDVSAWPCRGGCMRMVGVTEDTLDYKAQMDRMLKARSEMPLERDKIVFCEECRASLRKTAADLNRKQVDKLAAIIRELKEPHIDGTRERELLENARKLNHPDVDGLIQALAEQRKRDGNAKVGKRRL